MGTDAPRGIFESLKALIDRVLELLQGRVELLSTELEEELTRLVAALVWSIVSALAAILGVSFLTVMVLLFVPASFRPWAAAIIAVTFLGFAAIGYRSIKRIAAAKPRPFDASLRELEKDRAHLRGER
ncbi:MAG TPA: phage holin family protein [Candidatus Krumholzibacteria bacterium]|nr:phage holin family protein [Candidatus Krumholzibacteria bacterium]